MRRITLGLGLLAYVAITAIASAATTIRAASNVTNTALAIDGVFSTFVMSWEGGDVRGSVITVPGTSGATKSISNVSPAPLVVQIPFPPPYSVVELFNGLCSNQSIRKTLRLTDYDAMGVAVGAFEVTGAMLTEVTLPAFDASLTAMDPMRLVFNVEQSRVVAPGSAAAGSSAPRTAGPLFTLAIDGLDMKSVMRVEPITISRYVTPDAVGMTRDYNKTPGMTQFSNLRVTGNVGTTDTWSAWHTSFVVNGNNGDASEKKGSLALLEPDLKLSNGALNFGHLGILRVSRRPVSRGAVPTVEAEFYFENLDLVVPKPTDTKADAIVAGDTASGSSVTDVSNAGAGKIQQLSDSTAPIVDAPKIFADSVPLVSPTASTAPLAGTKTVLPVSVPLATTTATTAPAIVAALNPADQGSRDPAEFPRAAGLTRETYAGTFQKTYTSESATYTSKDSIYQLVAKVEAAAKAAGWTMTTLSESSSTNGKTVGQGWTKPSATASVGFQEAQDGSSTKLNLGVYVNLPPPN